MFREYVRIPNAFCGSPRPSTGALILCRKAPITNPPPISGSAADEEDSHDPTPASSSEDETGRSPYSDPKGPPSPYLCDCGAGRGHTYPCVYYRTTHEDTARIARGLLPINSTKRSWKDKPADPDAPPMWTLDDGSQLQKAFEAAIAAASADGITPPPPPEEDDQPRLYGKAAAQRKRRKNSRPICDEDYIQPEDMFSHNDIPTLNRSVNRVLKELDRFTMGDQSQERCEGPSEKMFRSIP